MLVSDPELRKEGLREIEKEVSMLKEVQHDHIVQLVTTYLFSNNYAIIMDPLADENLDGYLLKATTSQARETIRQWFGCLLSGISYAHGRGIRHRDIKPQNILVKGSNVYLADFGISMMGIGKTVPTTIIGRPRSRSVEFCSPEVEKGHSRGRSADIFSLGAVFLEMLTVCSNPGKLEEFRATLQSEGRQSYGLRTDMVSQWLDTLGSALSGTSWQSDILAICRKMLQEDRGLRPKAGDLRSWLAYKLTSATSSEECRCSLSSAESDEYSNVGMNEKLRTAYMRGERLMVDLWVERGAQISANDALIAASEGGLRDIVQSLIEQGADANSKGALQGACAGGFKDVVETLLEHGADIDQTDDNGRVALHAAVSGGHRDVVELLLRKGADVEIEDSSKRKAVQLAIINGHDELVTALQRNGADGTMPSTE